MVSPVRSASTEGGGETDPTLEWMIWHMTTEPSFVVAYQVYTDASQFWGLELRGVELAADLSFGVDAPAAVPLEVLCGERTKQRVGVAESGLDGVDVRASRC